MDMTKSLTFRAHFNRMCEANPPYGILDKLDGRQGEHVGCEDLLTRVRAMRSIKAHVFGHIHCARGEARKNGIHFVNASICDEAYRPVQAPIILDL